MKDIAIFIPARNVANTLPQVLDRIPQKVKDHVGEICIFDNDSKDNTYLMGIEYKEKNNMQNLKVYRNNANLGYGGTQKKAYRYAIEKKFKIVVMLHGDAQYAPESIPDIVDPIQKGKADFVFGSRMSKDPLGGGMPIWRYLGNRFLTKVENMVLDLNLSEFHSGYRAFSTDSLSKLPFQKLSDDYNFDAEILIQFALAKMRIVEVPIPTHYGKESGSPTISEIMDYSFNILKSMATVFLHKHGIRKQEKFKVFS